MSWQKIKLAELVNFKTGKLNSNAAIVDGTYPFFTCSQEVFRTNTFSFDTEAVLLGGNNANGIYPLKYFVGKFDAYQRTYVITSLDESLLLNRFLFYLLYTKLDEMRSISTGAATKFLTLTILKDIEIALPEIVVQKKITSILSAYDNLIENNTHRIKILEEMTQTIYKEWFVNFRFPGYEKVKFIDSALGKISEGWQVVEVRDIVKRLKAGNVYTEKEVNIEGDVIVIDQSTEEFLGFHNNEPDHNATAEKPIIIFGDHTCKMQIMVEPFSVGPNVVPFTKNGKTTTQFLFYLVNELVETKEYKRHWNELIVKKVVLPLLDIQMEFSSIATSNLEMIDTLKIKNQNLRKTRDLLLPKLMSGEVEV